MNTSWPRILAVLVLVNFFPAKMRNKVDFPAIDQDDAGSA